MSQRDRLHSQVELEESRNCQTPPLGALSREGQKRGQEREVKRGQEREVKRGQERSKDIYIYIIYIRERERGRGERSREGQEAADIPRKREIVKERTRDVQRGQEVERESFVIVTYFLMLIL